MEQLELVHAGARAHVQDAHAWSDCACDSLVRRVAGTTVVDRENVLGYVKLQSHE